MTTATEDVVTQSPREFIETAKRSVSDHDWIEPFASPTETAWEACVRFLEEIEAGANESYFRPGISVDAYPSLNPLLCWARGPQWVEVGFGKEGTVCAFIAGESGGFKYVIPLMLPHPSMIAVAIKWFCPAASGIVAESASHAG